MNTRLRLLLGACLILAAVFWSDLEKIIPTIPDDNRPNININKPDSLDVLNWEDVAGAIDSPEDRVRLCVFNKIFAERVLDYDADAQQINDIYVLAAKNTFGNTLKGKYEELGSAIQGAMLSVLGTENHDVIEPEKIELSKKFMAFAWYLNN
jgi:hypothetical protein|tara:strand:- start:230 stop:685 length:456 start_codon:yes stop_codon:yes gene_type:complete